MSDSATALPFRNRLIVFAGALLAFVLISTNTRANTSEIRSARHECFPNPSSGCLIDVALALARLINDTPSRAQSLLTIAKAQAKVGLIADARATFNEVLDIVQSLDAETQSSTLQAVAVAQSRAGFVQESVSTFSRSRAGQEQSDWARGLRAQLYALNGNIDGAQELVHSIEDDTEKIEALIEIGKAQRRSKRLGDVRVLTEAKNIVRSHSEIYPRFRIEWLCDVSSALVNAKQVRAARSVLRLASNISESSRAIED